LDPTALQDVMQVPLVCLVAASNEPPEDQDLGALYDRFLLRRNVSALSDDGREAMIRGALDSVSFDAANAAAERSTKEGLEEGIGEGLGQEGIGEGLGQEGIGQEGIGEGLGQEGIGQEGIGEGLGQEGIGEGLGQEGLGQEGLGEVDGSAGDSRLQSISRWLPSLRRRSMSADGSADDRPDADPSSDPSSDPSADFEKVVAAVEVPETVVLLLRRMLEVCPLCMNAVRCMYAVYVRWIHSCMSVGSLSFASLSVVSLNFELSPVNTHPLQVDGGREQSADAHLRQVRGVVCV
jgi:hypothetical protein